VEGKVLLGGPAYYIGIALHCLEVGARVVTSSSPTSRYLRKLWWVDVVEAGIGDTVFRIELAGGGRELVLVSTSKLDPTIVTRALEGFTNLIISETMSELDLSYLSEVVAGKNVVVDVQGFVRVAETSGRVLLRPNAVYSIARLLSRARYIILRGERVEFPEECWREPVDCSSNLEADIVITDGERPFVVTSREEGRTYVIKPLEGVSGRPIGLGDVFTAVLSYYVLEEGLSLPKAAVVASAAATLKLRDRHPWFTRRELNLLSSKVRISRLS